MDSSKIDNKLTTDVILKMSNLNLLTKINLLHPNEDKSVMNGNVLIKKGKNKFLATFNYEDDEIKIIKDVSWIIR